MSVLKVLAGFIVGAIAGAALALALCVAAAEIFSISQMEGAYAMQVAFFYMPQRVTCINGILRFIKLKYSFRHRFLIAVFNIMNYAGSKFSILVIWPAAKKNIQEQANDIKRNDCF